MALKHNAKETLEKRYAEKEEEASQAMERATQANASMRHTMYKLLAGEHILAEEGREFFWDLIANANIMRTDPMTGNSRTYWLLGKQSWPEDLLKLAKDVNIDLYQKMEKESINRKNRRLRTNG